MHEKERTVALDATGHFPKGLVAGAVLHGLAGGTRARVGAVRAVGQIRVAPVAPAVRPNAHDGAQVAVRHLPIISFRVHHKVRRGGQISGRTAAGLCGRHMGTRDRDARKAMQIVRGTCVRDYTTS